MKNLDEIFGSIIEEISFDVKSREAASTRNYATAKRFLYGVDGQALGKEIIDKIKDGKSHEVNPTDLENHLLSLHIVRKVAGNKRIKEVTRSEASEILKVNGINIADPKAIDKEIIKKAKETFNEKYEQTRETPDEQKQEQRPEEPKREEKPREEEPEKEKEVEPEKEAEPEKRQPFGLPKRAELGEVKPEEVPSVIRRLKTKTLSDIKRAIESTKKVKIDDEIWNSIIATAQTGQEVAEEDEESASKRQVAVLRRAVGKMMKDLDKYAERARQMPSTALGQLERAKTSAVMSQYDVLKLATPSALSILAGRVGETAKGAVEKVKEVGGRAIERLGKTPVGERLKSTIKTGKEYATAKTGEAIERAQSKMKEREATGEPSALERAKSAVGKVVSKAKEGASGLRLPLIQKKAKSKISDEERRKNAERFIKRKEEKEKKTTLPKIREVKF